MKERLVSLDAYRGFVMLLMLAEVLHWEDIAKAVPGNAFLAFMGHHQSHVSWEGCSLHDLIQPSFSFLVGVALPFSLSSRLAQGQSKAQLIRHAFGRALTLILLGIFLRSLSHPQTYFTFEDTLTQIGLGYGFLFLLGLAPRKVQWAALGVILVGYWAAFALSPLPPPGFDTLTVGVKPEWPHHLSGFAAHWEKNANVAMRFDQWFLNLFPREETFHFNGGGYATLSFIPTLGTMLLGLLAGGVLRNTQSPQQRLRVFLMTAVVLLLLGSLLGWLGICPVVKRIWTPSWVLFSGGWCFLFLAAFYYFVDVRGQKRPVFALVVIGMNSIAAYCLSWLVMELVEKALYRHFGHTPFLIFGTAYEPLLHGSATLALLWWILFWMHRRQLFLRI
jgi:heparan-alpha-glucosaminide N-acetyltransferase